MQRLRIGMIGMGARGKVLLRNLLKNFPDVDIVAVCDSYEDRALSGVERVREFRATAPAAYTDYRQLLADENVDVVLISASWEDHVPLAVASMKSGKPTALEVGGAYSVEDCWKLVHTWEETQTPFFFMENCCYGSKELLATALVRDGTLGEVVYCHGAYCHDARKQIADGVAKRHYRLRNYLARNCNNYPTHSLGPIAKILNINRGNRMLKLVSMASKSRGVKAFIEGKEEYDFLKDKTFAQGDVVTTMITCADGTLITLKLDTTLPRAYSREFTVSATKGIYSEQDNVLLTDDMGIDHDKGMGAYRGTPAQFEDRLPKVWRDRKKGEGSGISGGHGGMDGIMLRSFFDAVRAGEEMPIDVYDAASWMAVSCLSEASIANGGMPIDIPDFTRGAWRTAKPQHIDDVDLKKMGFDPSKAMKDDAQLTV